MIKSLDDHKKNIRPEVRAAARAKAMDIVVKMSSSGANQAKRRTQPDLAENRENP